MTGNPEFDLGYGVGISLMGGIVELAGFPIFVS